MHFVKIISLIICMIAFGFNVYSENQTYENFLIIDQVEQIEKIVDQYVDAHFDSYLKELTSYNIDEYRSGIIDLFVLYRKDYSTLEQCTNKRSRERDADAYSKQWIDDIKKQFGSEYITNNYESIKQLMVNLFQMYNATYCKEAEKAAIYSEIQYVTIVRDFFECFVKYFETLSEKDKKQYQERYLISKTILKVSSKCPLQTILYGGDIGRYLGLDNRVALRQDVFDFIVNHPTFKKPFPVIKAVEDLRAALEK